MNQPSPIPATPTCPELESLLPLAARDLPSDLLDDVHAARIRAHVANCAHCQRELALHARMDVALRQAFAVRADAAPVLPRERLAALLADDAPPVSARPSLNARATPRRPRLSVLAGLPAAAVLLIALFAGYLFHLGGRGVASAPTATLAFHLPPGTRMTSIAPVGANEWWAAGAIWNPAYGNPGSVVRVTPGTSYVNPIIVHYVGGLLSIVTLPPSLVGRAYGVELNAIAMVSPSEGWAVGNTVLPPNADGWTTSVLLHYIGGEWTLAHAGIDGWLDALAMRTQSGGWIAGRDNAGNTLILHYNGATWTSIHATALAQLYIKSIATPAPNDVWMVGYHTQAGDVAAIVHYDGARWTVESGPCPNATIAAIAMTSPHEGWAIADTVAVYYQGADAAPSVPATARILRYYDGVWEQQATFTQPASAPYFDLVGLAMRSASDGWAVGSQGTLIHYTGGRWIEVSSPTGSDLSAVGLGGTAGGWAIGNGLVLFLAGGRWVVA